MLAHRRLIAFVLTAAAVAIGVQATRPPPPETTALTVAARDLPAGTTLTADDLTVVRVPPHGLPDGVEDDPVGEMLAAPVRRGEPVTDLRLVGPGLTAGHDDLAAVPVRFADPEMASLLHVGDAVDVYATDPATARSELATPTALVMALPSTPGATAASTPAAGEGTSVASGRLVILGVPPESVPTLTAAGVAGVLTFAYPA